MEEYCITLTCCIHDYVFHWCQQSIVSIKTDIVANREHDYTDCVLMMRLSAVEDMVYIISWWSAQVHVHRVEDIRKLFKIFRGQCADKVLEKWFLVFWFYLVTGIESRWEKLDKYSRQPIYDVKKCTKSKITHVKYLWWLWTYYVMYSWKDVL